MQTLPIAVIDSFAEKAFSGNPAGVCLLDQPLSATQMQAIAMEMSLSETAFVEKTGEASNFSLRWFTPTLEIDLCGHATLASAYWMLKAGWTKEGETVRFQTKSGELRVSNKDGMVRMDFPLIPTVVDVHPHYPELLFGSKIVQAAQLRRNWIFELEDEASVLSFLPDLAKIAETSEEGFIVTAAGSNGYDMVSRYFGPNVGVPEDPVTGFAHCALVDYWNQKTGKTQFKAFQASQRGGELLLEIQGNRVIIQGKAVVVLIGNLYVDD